MSQVPRRILLTGGAGFIGSHTAVVLIQNGYDVEIIDNFSNSSPSILKGIERIVGRAVKCHVVDLCNFEALSLVLSKAIPFDGVIHFAGLKAVGQSVADPLLYYQSNLISTINLLRVMEVIGCGNLVFSSSSTVYGNSSVIPTSELEPHNPCSPYGHTKAVIETMLMNLAHRPNSKWRIALLRYFNPCGAHSSGLIGESPHGTPTNLVPYICSVAAGRLPMLDVFGGDYPTPDGTPVRDYIHVMDVAKGHLAALSRAIFGTALEKRDSRCEAYNLGIGKGLSVLDIIRAFEKASGKSVPYRYSVVIYVHLTISRRIVGRRPGDVAITVASVSKAKDDLDWSAEMDENHMAIDAWKWQIDHSKPQD